MYKTLKVHVLNARVHERVGGRLSTVYIVFVQFTTFVLGYQTAMYTYVASA